MSSLVLSVPGKSFLAGEYLALKKGPCLMCASRPRFELVAQTGTGKISGIHAASPAGKLLAENAEYFQKWDLEFVDPHEGRGGWGASTAQFLTAYVLNEWRASCELETLKSLSISRLLEAYWKQAWSGEGQQPSGADLVAQYKGALTLFEKRAGLVAVYDWNFSEIDFALIPTGKKLATHEHLKTLADFDESSIESAMTMIKSGLQSGNSEEFVVGIESNGRALEELGLVAPHTQEMLRDLLRKPGVLAAKGCGALGADVVLVIYSKAHRDQFKNFVSAVDVTRGLEIQVRE